VLQRRGEFGEHKQTKGVDEQRLLAIDRLAPSTGKRPVRPVAWDSKRSDLGVAQAQSLYARDLSDLEDSKSLTTKYMEGMGYLSRAQILTVLKCSST